LLPFCKQCCKITEKVTCDVSQKMKRDIAKSVDLKEVIDLSMVDDEELENKKYEKHMKLKSRNIKR